MLHINCLDPAPIRDLSGSPDENLSPVQVERHRWPEKPGFPDRAEMRAAEPGEIMPASRSAVFAGAIAAIANACRKAAFARRRDNSAPRPTKSAPDKDPMDALRTKQRREEARRRVDRLLLP